MGRIGTKNIHTGKKTLEPGNHKVKILNVVFEKINFKKKNQNDPDSYYILFYLEGVDLGSSFTGFYLDKDDQSKGRHKGMVGRVKSEEWAFRNAVTKGGIEISRDQEILKFLSNMCKSLEVVDWLDSQDDKHETVDSLIETFCKSGVYKDKWINVCIGGKEYINAKKYLNYDLYFPKFTALEVPFELVTVPETESRLIKFNRAIHIKKKKVDSLESFGEEDEEETTEHEKAVNKDFEL